MSVFFASGQLKGLQNWFIWVLCFIFRYIERHPETIPTANKMRFVVVVMLFTNATRKTVSMYFVISKIYKLNRSQKG